MDLQDGTGERWESFGIKMVPSILISLPYSPAVLIKAEKVAVWTILGMQ